MFGTYFGLDLNCGQGAQSYKYKVQVITIGNEIFDANEEFSLPLVLDSLHRCVGHDHQYLGVASADRFMAGANASKSIKASAIQCHVSK